MLSVIATENDFTDYRHLMESIQAPKAPLCEPPDGKTVMLRHDIDHSIDKALDFARAEYEMGYRSTYFLLHTAPYFDYSSLFRDQVRELQDLGHEVGIHNNFISEWYRTGTMSIARSLGFLRSAGVDVFGTASHGDQLCYEHGFINYEVWTECYGKNSNRKPREKEPPWPRFSLKEFGLEYEAYFLHRDAYLTDSGHHWVGAVKKMPAMETTPNPIGKDETIDRFNAMEGDAIMQVLTHPIWWKVTK
jgi:hypothetical protein